MGGNVPGKNFLGDNFPGGISGEEFDRQEFPAGNFRRTIFYKENKITEHFFK